MLTAVLHDFNRLGAGGLAPIPEPGPDEALVRIKSCGICATDYKAIKGIRRNVRFPLVPGHEPAGVVAAVGAHVRSVKEGDEVIVCPQRLLRTLPVLPHGPGRTIASTCTQPEATAPTMSGRAALPEYMVTGANRSLPNLPA